MSRLPSDQSLHFDPVSMQRITAAVLLVERWARGGGGRPRKRLDVDAEHVLIAKTPAGGIAKRTGTSPGSAQCEIYALEDGVLVSRGRTETVYNLASSDAIPADTFLIVVREDLTGRLLADWEDCPDA